MIIDGNFFLSLGPANNQVQNFQVTMRTATEVHLSWDTPVMFGIAYYQVRRNNALMCYIHVYGS